MLSQRTQQPQSNFQHHRNKKRAIAREFVDGQRSSIGKFKVKIRLERRWIKKKGKHSLSRKHTYRHIHRMVCCCEEGQEARTKVTYIEKRVLWAVRWLRERGGRYANTCLALAFVQTPYSFGSQVRICARSLASWPSLSLFLRAFVAAAILFVRCSIFLDFGTSTRVNLVTFCSIYLSLSLPFFLLAYEV